MEVAPSTARFMTAAVVALSLAGCGTSTRQAVATYEGKPVAIGNGTAKTVVRTDAGGRPASIAVVFTESALDGLPADPGAAGGPPADFAYLLTMPERGPRSVVDHVVVNWNPGGHPPPKVYDVPHFDFHFYLVASAEREKVHFAHDGESGDPSQQPPAELLPAGYIIPPGTAVPKMGVHAINTKAPEFNGQFFTATFIYGFHNRQQTFLEPMVTVAYLKTKPTFSAPVDRPARFIKVGAYPSRYGVRYDAATRSYEVSLDGFR